MKVRFSPSEKLGVFQQNRYKPVVGPALLPGNDCNAWRCRSAHTRRPANPGRYRPSRPKLGQLPGSLRNAPEQTVRHGYATIFISESVGAFGQPGLSQSVDAIAALCSGKTAKGYERHETSSHEFVAEAKWTGATHRARARNDQVHDAALLHRPPCARGRSLPRMRGSAQVRTQAPGDLSVSGAETCLQSVRGTLLQRNAARTRQNGDALRGAADVVTPPDTRCPPFARHSPADTEACAA